MSDRGTRRRLIESAFPLKEASVDSVHEKNVRHGHISTLHICPARRPLAASRAVLLATLLEDPGSEGRADLLRRIGGTAVKKMSERGEKEETSGGVLRWGRESSPELAQLREEIQQRIRRAGAQGTRSLRGGWSYSAGSHAARMRSHRLGHQPRRVVHSSVHLHYPRLMAGQTRPLPDFALRDRAFVDAFLKARGIKRKSELRTHLARLGHGDGAHEQQTTFDVDPPEARRGLSVASPRLGTTGAGGSASGACLALPDLRGVRAGQTQRPPWKAVIAAEAL